MAITYASTTQTQTYAGIIAIARAKLDELSDESFLTTRPGVLGTDNSLYLDLLKEELYFGDFSVDLSFLTACPHLLGGGVGELNVTLDKGWGTAPRHR